MIPNVGREWRFPDGKIVKHWPRKGERLKGGLTVQDGPQGAESTRLVTTAEVQAMCDRSPSPPKDVELDDSGGHPVFLLRPFPG